MQEFIRKNGVTKLPGFGQPGLRELHEAQERQRIEAFEKRWAGRRKIRTEEEKKRRKKAYADEYRARHQENG